MKTTHERPDLFAPHSEALVTGAPPGTPGFHPTRPALPPGWRSLATGHRGARLYEITLPDGAGLYWEVTVILREELVRRRFASEMHARAWLDLATEKRPSGVPFDLHELSQSIRAIRVAGGDDVSVRGFD